MDETGVTVYFARFELTSTEEEFRELFSPFGNIEKLFLHKTKNYGMVEFDNKRSCLNAIEALHEQPPLNLYVNMARNQIHSNGNASAFSTRRPQNYNKFNQSYNKQPNEHFIDESITYDECDYYVDENNEFVTVFTDPMTNEIYVPLRYAPTLRKVTRRVPIKMNNFENDERTSVKSDNSERRAMAKKNDFKSKYPSPKKAEDATEFRKLNDSHQGSGNLFDKKKYEQNDTCLRNHIQRNEENPNANCAVPKFAKNGVRAQKPFGKKHEKSANNNEDWPSSGSNHSKSNDLKASSVNSDKVESVRVSAAKSKNNIVNVSAKNNQKSELKTLTLPNNQFTEVHVENVVNEAIGWVTLTSKIEEFEKLTMEIYGIIDAAPACDPEVGKLVLALYENIWFRAIILSIAPEIRVRYIDYGNEEVITKADIKEIVPEFAEIPAFALCIKLANGAPCKMANDITIKVKPIKNENNFTVVHVENGIYEIEAPQKEIKEIENVSEIKETEKESNHALNVFHKILISQLDVGNTGFLELTIGLSKTKFIAAFMPLHLTEEAANLQNIVPPAEPTFKPVVGEIVCAENEEGWQRVYLLKIENNTTYKVAFIDYGTINDVSEVRSLPNQFINIPIFCCVCSAVNNDDLTQIKEAIDFEVIDVSGNNITCAIKISEKQVNIVCSPWDPRDRHSMPEFSDTKANVALEEIILKNGEDVKLEMESDGYLYVRNKQASDIRKKIDKYMAVHGPQAASMTDKPYVGQLVTAEYEGDFYRAIIKSIKNNDVTICYIDYGNEETLPFFSLKNINDEMTKEPISIIKIRLRHFINKPFSLKHLKYLENLSMKQIILKAIMDQNPKNGYDLKMPNGASVSEELEKLNTNVRKAKPTGIQEPLAEKEKQNEFYKTIKVPSDKDPVILMSELPLVDIPMGKTEVIFQQFSDVDNNILCVCINDPKLLHKVHVEMQVQMSKYVAHMLPQTSYEPEIEECVLVQSAGKWYRGACTSQPENNEYTIFLVDYGSSIQFSSKDIRRMPKEFAKEKALCNFAQFEGMPDNPSPSLLNRRKTLFERNHSYPVNVLQKIEEDECYIIEFPTIVQVLKEEKLF